MLSWYLVPAANLAMCFATRHQVYWRYDTDDMVSASTLIWYHAHWQTYIGHTGTNRMTHIYKYILTPPVLCTQQLPVLHWMNNLLIQMVQKFTLKRSIISWLFKINQKCCKWAKHTHNTERNRVNFRKG